MAFEPTEFERRPFAVQAAEISYDNIDDVAKWCKGEVDFEITRVMGGEVKLPIIKLAGEKEDKGKTLVARLGYYVVKSKNRFLVYKAPQFNASFQQVQKGVSDEQVVEATQRLLDVGILKLQDEPEEETNDYEAPEGDNSSVDGQETVMVNLGGQNLL